MICKQKLKNLIRSNGLTFKDLADILGISYGSLMYRLDNSSLKSSQIEALISIFGLTAEEYEPIFFSNVRKFKSVYR